MSKHLSPEIRVPIEEANSAIVRTAEKCINCKLCTKTCRDYINVLGTYNLEDTNDVPVCIHCGQCVSVCPVSNITEKYEYQLVKEAINDPEKIVIISTAPAVRVALGEEFGMEGGSFVEGKMVALLKRLGADYVLDTNFSADLTIAEEAAELVERIKSGSKNLPQFTSCCPSWVKYAEIYHPDMLGNLSSAKSPIGMHGAIIKTYFAQKMSIDPSKIVNVTVAPCTGKKFEIRREEMDSAGKYLGIDGMRDNDYVITTKELALWAKEENIDFASLEDQSFDKIMGEASGAGVIFGNTGGVMEAALRTAYTYITGEKAPAELLNLEPVRGLNDVKEATVKIGDLDINVAVVYGTGNASKLIEKIKSGEKKYHFIEVMTCPGGCISGGGQPKALKSKMEGLRKARIESLYSRDSSMDIRSSIENPEIKQLYSDFLGKPLGELSEKLLHTSFHDRSSDLGKKN